MYDVPREGITRMQNLQEKLDTSTRDYAKLLAIFRALQRSSDSEAANLLARIRLGSMIDELLPLVGWQEENPGQASAPVTPVE